MTAKAARAKAQPSIGKIVNSRFASIPIRHQLSAEEFQQYTDQGTPVIISGMTSGWPALDKWSPEYFKRKCSDLKLNIKEYGDTGFIKSTSWSMGDYVDYLLKPADGSATNDSAALPYCHDVPIFSMIEGLFEDAVPFPLPYLPEWYHDQWWRYVQFFMGPANSLTPLHFDTLLTHNLFVQVVGRKRFTLIAPEDARYCAVRGWRWFDVDPEKPDLKRYPDYKNARPVEVVLNPGELLYLPPNTLHHVRSLDVSISFNIDFHTRKSALNGLLAIFRGMPRTSAYYNLLCTLGVVCGVPPNLIFRLYKPYLSYVS